MPTSGSRAFAARAAVASASSRPPSFGYEMRTSVQPLFRSFGHGVRPFGAGGGVVAVGAGAVTVGSGATGSVDVPATDTGAVVGSWTDATSVGVTYTGG